jgi:secondary thiamine-phosphate synthase enzyme
MQTLVPAAICHHARIRVATREATEFVDLTARIEALAVESGIHAGLVNVQSLHSTTAIVVNEYDPLLLVDVGDVLARAAPRHAPYRHDDPNARTMPVPKGEHPDGHAHCQALLLGSSASLHFADGCLQLGRWQRVFLVELDGPREREVSVLILGASER